jgi:capsular exopolysaccharide synthesis family protein
MELRQYINVLLKWWWLILASVAIAAISSLFASLSAPRSYQARTTLMVGQALQNPNPNSSDLYMGEALAQSYSDLARREPVLRSALSSLGLDWDWTTLQGMVTSRVVPATQLLEISVLDTDPQRAVVLVEEIANQLILQSPASANPEKDAERQFILSQIQDLKANINKGQQEIRQLDEVIVQSASARQIQEARARQATLQAQVSSWQATFAQLLSNLEQGATNSLTKVEPARMPSGPVGTGTMSNVLVAAAIGLVLSTAAAFVLEYLDDSIKTSDEIQNTLKISALASITRINTGESGKLLVTVAQPRSPEAEAYRILRMNLQFKAAARSLTTIMVTSTFPQEGKSITSSNLAVVLAQAGARVILVDADLRRPSQHQIFGLTNDTGLTTALLNPQGNLTELLQPSGVDNLTILTTGPVPPNPSELLGSKRMGEVLSALLGEADLVIFDSAPVLVASDASVLATRVDGTLLVIDAGRTRRGQAARAIQVLSSVGATLLGAILNRAAAHANGYGYYYDYSGTPAARRRMNEALETLRNIKRRFKRSSDTPVAPVPGAAQANAPLPTSTQPET